MNRIIEQSSYKELVEAIGKALNEGRNKAIQTVNAALVKTNWQIGHYIVEYEQKGTSRIWSRAVESPIARPDSCIRQGVQPKQRVSNEAVLFDVPKNPDAV